MGFLKRMFGKADETIEDPIALRTQLFTAANVNDKQKVLALCKANQERIKTNFVAWRVITSYPGVNANDAGQIQYIINGMNMVAETFRDALGDPTLYETLTDSGPNSPTVRFQKVMEQARTLSDEMRYPEAITVLTGYLDEIKNDTGPHADHFRNDAHGIIGASHFQYGDVAQAVPHFEKALSLCKSLNESQGVYAYTFNLQESHRYLGQWEEAAQCADRIAVMYAENPEGARWRARAARLRAGLPLVRVMVQQGEQKLEVEEVTQLEGITQWIFERNRPAIYRATTMIVQANGLADSGKYEEAFDYYRGAAAIDPYNPDPHYQAGKTLSLLKRYDESVAEYEIAERLGPGFYNVSSNLWLARELQAGRIPHEAFVAMWVTEATGMEPAEQMALIEAALEQAPHVPQLHLEKAKVHLSLGQHEEAAAAMRAGLACECDPDLRSRIMAQLGTITKGEEQRRLWEETLAIPGGNLSARAIAELHLRLGKPA
jgi:tetratricopeptide (TPR) repeat protein